MEQLFEILNVIFVGPDIPGLNKSIAPMVAAAGISAVVSLGKGIFGALSARKQRKRAESRASQLNKEIELAENQRAEIINPYEGFTDLSTMASDLSGMAKDVSGMATAPQMNLAVATKGAEMQIEEADIALANTLDTLASSGASAGGATALAQMALKSKQGVAAGIEQQEANNQKLVEENRIEGQLRIEDIKMQEAQRMQTAQMSEGIRMQGIQMAGAERMQGAEMAGNLFEYQEQEKRTDRKLNRLSAQLYGQEQQAVQSRQDQRQSIMGAVSGIGNAASNLAGAGFFKSDRKLKKDIKLIGFSPSGIKIYNFKYKNSSFGKGTYQGVMSDEIPNYAVITNNGFDMVDYNKIDVEFKNISL